jgi:hypothetical protein
VGFVPDTDLLESVCQENEKDGHRLVGRVADEQKSAKKVPPAVLARYAGNYEVEMLGTWRRRYQGNAKVVLRLPSH